LFAIPFFNGCAENFQWLRRKINFLRREFSTAAQKNKFPALFGVASRYVEQRPI
jgi:hypothetical protein